MVYRCSVDNCLYPQGLFSVTDCARPHPEERDAHGREHGSKGRPSTSRRPYGFTPHERQGGETYEPRIDLEVSPL
jgi:hypothetical protein